MNDQQPKHRPDDDDVLKEIEHHEPIIPDSEFVADPDLTNLYKQVQAAAREHGWDCPSREEFERLFKAEMRGKIQR